MMNTTEQASPAAVAGQVDRPVRPLYARLRDWRGDPDEVMNEAADLLERLHGLLWALHPECCGRPEVGDTYGGRQEPVCCGCYEVDMLNDAQIVASLRAMLPEAA